MYVEFLGLPGSGKSTLLASLVKRSAQSDFRFRPLNEAAEEQHAKLLNSPGYVSRKPGRGWLYATLTFAQTYPEVFRTLFENTIESAWENQIAIDFLGQFQLAKKSRTGSDIVLCDEGFLHRGAVACSKPNLYSDIDTYLQHIPRCGAVIFVELDVATSLERCKARPKGLPNVYKPLTEEQIIEKMTALKDMHEICAAQQEQVGAQVLRIDGNRPVSELCEDLFATLTSKA